MSLIAYFKKIFNGTMESQRGFWPALIPLIPTGISLLSKLFGGSASKGYPQFNYNQQLPQQNWDRIFNLGMAGPRREASRFSQAATKTTLPGGPRMQAQAHIGSGLMNVANRQAGNLAKMRAGFEIPWYQHQQGLQREDMLRKFLMNKEDLGGFMEMFSRGAMGTAQNLWGGGGGGMDLQKMMQMFMGGDYGLRRKEPRAFPRPELPPNYWG